MEQSPVQVGLDAPLEVARWRPFLQGILAIPHFFVASVLGYAAGFVVFLAWFAILFTGRFPESMFGFVAMVHRYQWRTTSYAMFLREAYPPFEYVSSPTDPGGDPATYSIAYPERLSRGLIFVKALLAFPHYIALMFAFFATYVVMLLGFVVVLITGRWPEGMRAFVVGVMRWNFRVQAYIQLMTDAYPPFSLT